MFTAEEAKQLTLKALKGPVIRHFIEVLDAKILKLAGEGVNSVDPHLYLGSMRWVAPTINEWEAIKNHYVGLGFSWKDYPDPDPGHPCSHPYTLISW